MTEYSVHYDSRTPPGYRKIRFSYDVLAQCWDHDSFLTRRYMRNRLDQQADLDDYVIVEYLAESVEPSRLGEEYVHVTSIALARLREIGT